MGLLPNLAPRNSLDPPQYIYPNTTSSTLSVICAYPLSGQYGPGTRYLYYGLVAICIFARREEWLREPCLAAALLFPALASIHAIVLACYSNAQPVDFDIYGVLVVIAVATLAMPLTLRFSRTYFNTPGRNLVFLCAILNLAGLVSLSVAFFRAQRQNCIDNSGHIIYDIGGDISKCPKTCDGIPDTPIRADSNNPMQPNFAPRKGVTLNTGFLLSVAFCVVAFLSIVTMWNQVVLDNARRLGFVPHEDVSILPRRKEEGDQTRGGVRGLLDFVSHPPDNFSSGLIRLGLHLIEMLVYSAAMLATIIISEITFWSADLRAGVEPMTSVGQWSPIVGALISSMGALYCAFDTEETPAARARAAKQQVSLQVDARLVMSPEEDREGRFTGLPPMSPDSGDAPQQLENALKDIAGRRRFADIVRRAGSLLDPDPDRYNNKAFRGGRYRTYPRTPGEENLNPYLRQHEERFYQARGAPRSQVSLVIPGTPTAIGAQASGSGSGSGSQTPRPEGARHARSDSGGSMFLEVPRAFHRGLTSVISEPTPQPNSLLFDNDPPRITIT